MIKGNIYDLTKNNENFRKVLFTGIHSQIVAMAIVQNDDIGEEVHETVDQILFIVQGTGEAVVNGESQKLGPNDYVFVTAGSKHNIINRGETKLKLFTVYSPPNHPANTIHKTKEEASESHY